MLAPLEKAINLAGGQSGLADLLSKDCNRKVWQSVVRGWIIRERVPAEWCKPIERVLNGKVKAPELRPDIFARGRA